MLAAERNEYIAPSRVRVCSAEESERSGSDNQEQREEEVEMVR